MNEQHIISSKLQQINNSEQIKMNQQHIIQSKQQQVNHAGQTQMNQQITIGRSNISNYNRITQGPYQPPVINSLPVNMAHINR